MARAAYRTIVADPPWPIGDFPQWFASDKEGVVPRPYGVMSLAKIKALPVAEFAERTAHLYLWTITDYLEDSFEVARNEALNHVEVTDAA